MTLYVESIWKVLTLSNIYATINSNNESNLGWIVQLAERVQSRLALTRDLRVGFIPLEFSFTENNTMPPLVDENAVTQFP